MKKCPHCAEAIQNEARVCRYCQRDVTGAKPAPVQVAGKQKTGGAAKMVLGLVLVAVVLGIIGSLSAPAPSSRATTKAPTFDLAKAQALVDQGKAAGYITRFTCVGNEADVTPVFWMGMDAEGKRSVAITLAAICNAQNSGNRITIFNSQSGRELASLSGLGTFTVK